MKEYYEKVYANKLTNQKEVNKFLETYNFLKLNEEEIENLNKLITSKEIKSIIKKIPTNKSSGLSFPGNSTNHLKN